MKILILSQFFSTTKGGGEYVFSLIAKTLAENGNKVWIITNQIKGETYPQHQNLKIIFVPPVIEYKGGLPPGFGDNIGFVVNAIKAGLTIIKKEQIDLIHSNNFSPALAGSLLSFFTSKPHVTTIHDVFSLCGKNYWNLWGKQSDVSKINVILAPFFERLMMKLRYDCIHTVSEATKDDLLKFGTKKPIYVIPNAISTKVKETRIDTVPFQFIYVGRLVFYKNLEVVIKAIDIVRKTESKIKLLIIGDGPHRRSLEKMVNELKLEYNVEFKGYVSAEEKAGYTAQSNALVFPSLCEGFGLVILEAFEQKRPVLVSNVRPLSDIVSNGVNGYVLDAHDETLWADHLHKIVENPKIAEIMGKNGKQALTSSYNEDLLYKKILEMYCDILKMRR